MKTSYSDIYRYIVRELAPSPREPDNVPLTIICEPLDEGEDSPHHTVILHLVAGTSMAEAQAMADALQAKVKTVCHIEKPASRNG